MTRKFKAFTLMELLIGMIVSSIVIAFGYSTYSIIYKQFSSYKFVKNKVVECMQLNAVLQNDFNNAEFAIFNENQLTLNVEGKALDYYFDDSLIVREENRMTDTFKLKVESITVLPVFNELEHRDHLIKNMVVAVSVNDEREQFTYTKIYDAETLMKYELVEKY